MTERHLKNARFNPNEIASQHPDRRAGTVDRAGLGAGDGVGGRVDDDGCSSRRGFHLIALPRRAAGRWRDLGSFPDLDSALLARVEDVLRQLARNDGWLITCEHLVLAPEGAYGPRVAGHITQLGADPSSNRVPEPHNEQELRNWLLTASGLTPQGIGD